MIINKYAPFLLTNYLKKTVKERQEKAKDCYMNGKCLHCGCDTPDVFFANRGCLKDEPCYDKMIPLWKRILKLLINGKNL